MDLSGTQGELPLPMHAAASPYVGLHHVHHHHNGGAGANGRHMSPPKPPATAMAEAATEENKNRAVVLVGSGARYRECLKNHAAAIGGSATDGCGEFMPAGEEGSLDALRCSACGCHRNFHRKELDYPAGGAWETGTRPPHHHHHHLIGGSGSPSPLASHRGHLLVAALPPPTRMVMPLSTMHTTESDDAARSAPRKRFRTKFTAEQKARMLGFAEEVGWRLQKLEDTVVQRFCQEVGVKRRVLKVWMHNNKHTLASRHQPPPQPEPGGPIPSSPQLRLE
ncbi:hypothetical protein GUJ93_ZPchr0009g1944 [Zizania palustris]|uniref:ZF-HD dimerization-type domain-containing protein n=2 Tax=Zizania palustris TaxID=103762 RepID=A0A8J5RQM4_ZIZPA|nr:hypothetical protein GUJ93_ZPchr0009g155 [Zizania palustris]KAG8051209.1 hypothetical protein GUJ93_ZPchr0009g1944 [Zizania palustris]